MKKAINDVPELQAVREAAARLEDKHFEWMIDALLEHFSAERERAHAKILRLERFPDAERFHRYGIEKDYDAAAALADQLSWLRQYEAVLTFAAALKRLVLATNARKFGAWFWANREKR